VWIVFHCLLIKQTKPSCAFPSFLALLDGLALDDAPASFRLIAALDDAPTPSFCVLSPTSVARGSCEVLANYPVATLLPKIIARVP
jgi:hypothetical protein